MSTFSGEDLAGHTALSNQESIVVDWTDPTVTLLDIDDSAPNVYAGGNTVYYGDNGAGSFTVSIQASDNLAGLAQISFPDTTDLGADIDYTDGRLSASESHDYDFDGNNGSYTDAVITAVDRALRTGSASFNVIHDATDPEISLSADANGASISVNWNANDTASGLATCLVQYSVGQEGALQFFSDQCTGTQTLVNAEPGVLHTFQLTATDNVGNENTVEVEATARHITKYYYFGAQRVAKRGPDNAVVWLHGDHLTLRYRQSPGQHVAGDE